MSMLKPATEKLRHLRSLMAAKSLAAYIVPSSDAHNSEYTADRDKRRDYISGFTGSAGTAVITASDARLWTDGRYFLQAEKQLDAAAGWKLMKDRLPETPTIEAWLASVLSPGEVVGVDPLVVTVDAAKRWKNALSASKLSLDTTAHENLVDIVWGEDKPAPPHAPAFAHDIAFAGVHHDVKLESVRKAVESEKCAGLVVSALDEIAWLFNIRGSDVACNPVVFAYALITADKAILCIDESKVDEKLRAHLGASVEIRPYADIFDVVSSFKGPLWMDATNANYSLLQAAQSSDVDRLIVQKMSPLQLAKAVKNDAEIEGMRQAHVRDGVALTSFFAWLEQAVLAGMDMRTGKPLAIQLNEHTVAEVLEEFRKAQKHFVGLSFETIAGMGPNGAIIHYRADEETAAPITKETFFLCDSGGQYLDGTTDVTRTLHFGTPTDHERLCYTRVLQAHGALARAVFPPGTSGVALDAIARSQLWQSGLDYRHGTGHGVGAFLNVHEGPFGAASVARSSYTEGIKDRITLTDEPGYYEDGNFGIRIENVLIATPASTAHQFGGKPYLGFESFTVVPISTKAVDSSLLTPADKVWLNGYNKMVADVIRPLVAPYVKDYIDRETSPIA